MLKYIKRCFIIIGFAPFDWEFKYLIENNNCYFWIGPFFIGLGSDL